MNLPIERTIGNDEKEALLDGIQGACSTGRDPRETDPSGAVEEARRAPNMISGWKRTAIKNMAAAFGKDAGSAAKNNDAEVEEMHATTGQLVVEWDCFASASVHLLGKRGRNW